MELTGIILVVVFFALLLLNVPISISIGVATLLAMLMNMDVTPATITIAQRMVGGLNSFALLAIPFFVLSGLIMGRGGIAKRLIECAMALIGALPGGLAFAIQFAHAPEAILAVLGGKSLVRSCCLVLAAAKCIVFMALNRAMFRVRNALHFGVRFEL